jgi:hypothetical protein
VADEYAAAREMVALRAGGGIDVVSASEPCGCRAGSASAKPEAPPPEQKPDQPRDAKSLAAGDKD